MMWYAIMAEDTPNSLEKRMAARPEHLARLQALQNEGRLLLAGPFPAIDSIDPGLGGYSGSLIVAEFVNLEAASKPGLRPTPFMNSGVYASVSVKPISQNIA